MLTASIIIFSVLIFPLFLNIDLYFSHSAKKLFFGVDLFGFIKLLSGYAQLLNDGIALHLSDKKAIIIFYKNITGMGKSVKPLRDYHIIKTDFNIETGSENNFFAATAAAYTIKFFGDIFGFHIYNVKPYVRFNYNIKVYEKDILNVYAEFTVLFNILMIIISLIKILTEKIIYGKRKQNKYRSSNRD